MAALLSPIPGFLRALIAAVILLALYGILAPLLENAAYALRLASMPAPAVLAMPVSGVKPSMLRDTWLAARSGGRKHHGIDIFAKRGTAVRSATEGIVLRVGTNPLGGRVVWVLGPGGQRHYYAHLDRFADVVEGMRVAPGDLLGFVGTTGNAAGTPPHLHYGIYAPDRAINPYPILAKNARTTS